MSQIYLISDTHFGSMYWSKYRHFNSPSEMDEQLFETWCATVGPNDKVYHLGDVANSKESLRKVKTLPGKKCLIKGNHDYYKLKEYFGIFYDIRSLHTIQFQGASEIVELLRGPKSTTRSVKSDVIFTHIPIASEQLNRYPINVHGHLHYFDETCPKDPRYINICLDWRLRNCKSIFVPLEEIEEQINKYIHELS